MATVWQSEFDPHASKVLKRHWPKVPNLGDITKIDWSEVEPVDIICGGFPCTDISLAGKGAGIKDGTRSGLWSYFADAIGALRPRYAFIENVASLITMRPGMDVVLADLAKIGFDAEWCCVQASEVGAPHQRNRVFILATNSNVQPRKQRGKPTPGQAQGGRAWADAGRPSGALTTYPDSHALRQQPEPEPRGSGTSITGWTGEDAPDADGERLKRIKELDSEAQGGFDRQHRRHADGRSLEDQWDAGMGISRPEVSWGDYELAIRRWEAKTRHAPPATDDRGRLAPSFVEWMMGFPEGWVDAIPRAQQLKCLGNAVVPQQAVAAWAELSGNQSSQNALEEVQA